MKSSLSARLAACLLALTVAGGVHAAGDGAAAADPAAATATAASAPVAAPVPAPAAARPAPAPTQSYAGTAAGSLLQTIFALCLVLGLLALLAWAMKRYGPRATGSSAHVRMVGGLSLGGRERIIVVEVGEQWIVVGASPGRVNALATMPRQGDGAMPGPAVVGGDAAAPAASAASFADWLKQTIAQRHPNR